MTTIIFEKTLFPGTRELYSLGIFNFFSLLAYKFPCPFIGGVSNYPASREFTDAPLSRTEWMVAVKRDKWLPNENTWCSVHFSLVKEAIILWPLTTFRHCFLTLNNPRRGL